MVIYLHNIAVMPWSRRNVTRVSTSRQPPYLVSLMLVVSFFTNKKPYPVPGSVCKNILENIGPQYICLKMRLHVS